MSLIRSFAAVLSQFIPLLLTFLLAASSYWYAMQSELSLFSSQGKKDPTVADYYLRNFSVQSQDLVLNRYSHIRSKSAEHIPQGNLWNITRPNIEQFEPQGTTVQGQALEGVYELDSDQLTLRKQVSVLAERDGVTTQLRSDSLVMDNPKQMIRSRDQVTIDRPGQHMVASGVEFNNSTGELKSVGPVKIRIEAKP
ncbi:LPS export ABC transporter periplasmic protein LptC [Limnobacter humi]|uniref:LPS export ABC transporter periplasmic protein LptC n=1 Tax=Limnobacter humi TaxID=1778671 RepID=A0ABT1WK36_9BURK|nr:LPS export ABC transporter periplasmic protein LptC [Limnobacter humi]MCQ8897441.1 LPS export ABC transporter periplasmic protein LptC [Limnobacter humi]